MPIPHEDFTVGSNPTQPKYILLYYIISDIKLSGKLSVFQTDQVGSSPTYRILKLVLKGNRRKTWLLKKMWDVNKNERNIEHS